MEALGAAGRSTRIRPRRASLRRAAMAAAAATAFFTVAARAAEPTQVEQVADDITTGAAVTHATSFLIVPLPQINPALGNGVTLVASAFYSPVQGGRPWVTGIGGMYTSEGDWAAGLAQQADLFQGRLRLLGFGGYGDFNLKFFGIGQAAGATGRSIALDEKGTAFMASALYQTVGSLYIGLKYKYLDLDSALASPLFPNSPIVPKAELNTAISGLGPAFEFDTRDSQFMPKNGYYVTGQWLYFNTGIGSDFAYNKLNLAANLYHSFGPNTVLAARASTCNASQNAPFYDLCFFGSQNDLRGYEGGQYRDHTMMATQVELRQHLFWRIGAVAFAGVGAVAPDYGQITDARALPSGGVGLRFQPTSKTPVNLSLDYAWGRGSQGLYLYLGEAF